MPPSSSVQRTQIPNLPAVVAVTGETVFEIVLGGVSYKCTFNQLRDWIIASMPSAP